MKKIIIIPDSFNGSASSLEVCECIERGVLKAVKDVIIKKVPIADGARVQLKVWFMLLGESL